MDQAVYNFRASLWSTERAYRIDGGTFIAQGRPPIAFTSIRKVRLYQSPGLTLIGGAQVAPSQKRCVIWPARGRAVVLSSNHFLSFGRFEDRSATYDPFVAVLMRQIAAANQATRFVFGMPVTLWLFWLCILVMALLLGPLALLSIIGLLVEGNPVSGGLIGATLILLGIAASAFSLTRMLRRNWPLAYDPRGGV